MRPAVPIYHSPAFLSYDLGTAHPLQQRRLAKVVDRLAQAGALGEGLVLRAPRPASDDVLSTVHSAPYVDAIRRASGGDRSDVRRWGIGPGDTPAFDGMHEAGALYCGATVSAALDALHGEPYRAINFSGGLHHAFPDHASGFCIYNDLALGVRTLLDGGCARVAYIDIDVHHGDGVEVCFRDDPRVLTLSIHESGRWLFPGTGDARDRGGPGAEESLRNIPLAPHTGDAVWWWAFESVVPVLLERFQPEGFVLQLGADAHASDPLAHLRLSSRGWLRAVDWLLERSRGLPTVITGGGGYHLPTVERLWAMAALRAADLPVPEEWHDDPIATTASEESFAREFAEESVRGCLA
ncbi:MAG: acetoin utilization protein AcuC [Armatimonadota bacterium]